MVHLVMVVLALSAPPDTGSAGHGERAAPWSAGAAAPAPMQSVIVRAPPRFAADPTTSPLMGSGATAVDVAAGRSEAMGGVQAEPLPADTPTRRLPAAIEYSDWYARRLAVHRVASYAMLPLFAAQYVTGSQLMAKGADAPAWAIRAHGPLATATAGLFALNTVTGVWNLWDARKDPEGRTSRTLHAVLMLAADAGFTVAGALATPAETSSSIRSLHRTIALSSIGASLLSYAIMLPPFRR